MTIRRRRTRASAVLIALVDLLGIAACSAPPRDVPSPGPGQTITIAGPPLMVNDLAPALAAAYLQSRGVVEIGRRTDPDQQVLFGTSPDSQTMITINIQSSSIGQSLADLAPAAAIMPGPPVDIAMATNPTGRSALPASASAFPIAEDGITVVVSPHNSVAGLTVAQLRAIYTCRITDWKAVGGSAGPIRLLTVDDLSSVLGPGGDGVLRGIEPCPAIQRDGDDQHVAAEVTDDPSAIALVGSRYADPARIVPLSDGASVGAEPTPDAIRTQDYPLTRLLELYTAAPTGSAADGFARFATSQAGQLVVERARFVRATTAPEPCTGWPDYCAMVRGALRLPVDVRFPTAVSALDTRAAADVRHLVAYLHATGQTDHRVLIAGFADDVGGITSNVTLSARRAATVGDELRAGGIADLETQGFGEVVGSQRTSADQRQLDRRVEVWVVP